MRGGDPGPGSPAPSVADAGGAAGQELDQLGAADDGGPLDQLRLVEAPLLETGRAHPDDPARLDEVGDQVTQRREALFVDVVGITLLDQADAFGGDEDTVSWSEPTAALAITIPTVARSGSFLALVRDTQNLPGMVNPLVVDG